MVDAEFEHDAVDDDARNDEISRLEAQVAHLSQALARALRDRQSLTSPPALPSAGGSPYERYRSLARRRRWWRF
jgi:hypothetical protein